MTKKIIVIDRNNCPYFFFPEEEEETIDECNNLLSDIKCQWDNGRSHCGVYLDLEYVRIIKALKKVGLLEEDYPLICCLCYNKYAKTSGNR